MRNIRDVVIVGYLRSPWSRARPREPEKDLFNSLRADDILSTVMVELIKRSGIKPEEIDEFVAGAGQPWGEQGLNSGRTLLFLSKFPFSISAHAVERACGTSMTAVHDAAMSIALGYNQIVLVGGMEHMTHVPMMGPGIDPGLSPLKYNMRFLEDPDLKKTDWITVSSMGLTAEKLASTEGFSREVMDSWSVRSHQRAHKATQAGFYKDEIMPFEVKFEGKDVRVNYDVGIRPETNMEALSGLKASFKTDGLITAGNASQLTDGASAMLLMSREKAKQHGLKPIASIVSMGWAGVDPTVMGKGPVPASSKALGYIGLEPKDVDYWEINEAFAVVPLYAIRELKLDPERVNINGGSVAIGHPLGATGIRLVGTLARVLEVNKGTYGVATPCCGGGQGVATVLKREG